LVYRWMASKDFTCLLFITDELLANLGVHYCFILPMVSRSRFETILRGTIHYAHSQCRTISAAGHPILKRTWGVLIRSWLNILLPCVPAGFVLNGRSGLAIASLIFNFLGAIPLLGLSDTALDQVTSKIGSRYGSLLYTSTRQVSVDRLGLLPAHAQLHTWRVGSAWM